METKYYEQIKDYYNADSGNLKTGTGRIKHCRRIRNSFREVSNQFESKSILEIGFGPGLDVIYFAQENPESQNIWNGYFGWNVQLGDEAS